MTTLGRVITRPKENTVADNKFSLGQMLNQLTAVKIEADNVRAEICELRTEFNDRINKLEDRLFALVGVTPPPAPPRESPDEQPPLWHWIRTVLTNSNEPLTVREIAQLVLEAGYVTTSDNEGFVAVVQQCLVVKQAKNFQRVKGRPKRPTRWSCVEEERANA
jgi:hypothetical protein